MSRDRRSFLKSTALAGTAGLIATAIGQPAARAAMGRGPDTISMRTDGTYDVVPLSKNTVSLGVVQSRVRGVRADNWKQDRQANLEHMLEQIDNAFHFGAGADILFFHEFPITGWNAWTREEILKFAIEIPGEETEAVARKAKEYGCYIVFGSYARDADWPNHVLSITTIVGPGRCDCRQALEGAQHQGHIPRRRAVHDDDLRCAGRVRRTVRRGCGSADYAHTVRQHRDIVYSTRAGIIPRIRDERWRDLSAHGERWFYALGHAGNGSIQPRVRGNLQQCRVTEQPGILR